MKRTIYLTILCLSIAAFTVRAQKNGMVDSKITQSKTVLGQPFIVNLSEAAAYDLLHPFKGKVRCIEQGEDEEKDALNKPPVLSGPYIKNDVSGMQPNQLITGITSPAPDLTFEGWSLTTTFPPDIRGAVGINHIMQVTNEGIKIFNKSGALLKTTTLKSFCPAASTSPLPPYDPHVVYDPNYNRYIFCCGGKLAATSRSGLFVAVSQTTDPTGNWYQFFVDVTGNTSDLFDYPLLGFNENWITITGNLFAGGTSFSSCKIVVIDRTAAYSGTATGAINIFTDATNVTTIAPAATIDANQTTQYLVQNSTGNAGGYGYVKLATVTGNVNAPVYALGSSVGINQPWSNSYVLVPQKGGTVKLDMRDCRIGNAVYRNGSLWFVHHVFLPSTAPTHCGVDWWQVNPSSGTVTQFSRIDQPGDSVFYFYPAIDVNASGDVLVNLCRSSANTYASAAYALHAHTDAPGFTEDPYIYKPGAAYYIRTSGGRNRWGDYTFAAVDPVDQSFWAFGEWAKAATTWSTAIAHIVATPDTNCNAPVGLNATNITDVSATLNWSPVSANAVSYTLQYRKAGTITWTIQTTTSKSYTVNGLTANTNYEWHVLNNCASGSISPYSSLSNFTTQSPCATIAAFSATPTLFCSAPATVIFSNKSINGNTFLWNFGDGNTSTSANPSHSYNTYGNYTVTLTATGCTVDSLKVPQYISVDSTIACSVSLPLAGIGPTQTGCIGQLYDSGGPDSSYTSYTDVSITIAPPGAGSIDLYFSYFYTELNYDFIWIYDGPTTGSPLIGKFSGGTLPNGGNPITSSGGSITVRQTTDALVNNPGFALTWQCAASNLPPVADFTADATSTCIGIIQFTDQSTHGATSWLWDFGDGQNSAYQNPSHTYTTNGIYTVKLIATNSHGSDTLTQSNYITVSLPTAPTISNPLPICEGDYTILTASGDPTITWYESQSGGSTIATGSTIITPPLFTTTTYYVASEKENAPLETGASYTIGGGLGNFYPASSGYYGLRFDCYKPATLLSVVMYANTSGYRRITLLQNGDTIAAKTIYLIANTQIDTIVYLNFELPAGTNLELGCKGVNVWRNTAGASFPYTLPGLLSITGNITPNQPTYYYYFYQWKVLEASCISARVPVVVTVDNGPNPSFSYSLASNNCSFTNTTNGAISYQWNFQDPASGTNNSSTLQNPTHVFTSAGVYHVCVTASTSNGCTATACQDITVLTVGTNDINTNAGITIYPNPITNELNLEFSTEHAGATWKLILTDILGNLVAEKTIYQAQSSRKYEWDLVTIAKGSYILTLQSNNQKIIREIIRQ